MTVAEHNHYRGRKSHTALVTIRAVDGGDNQEHCPGLCDKGGSLSTQAICEKNKNAFIAYKISPGACELTLH